jgi:hypothetical protein
VIPKIDSYARPKPQTKTESNLCQVKTKKETNENAKTSIPTEQKRKY